MAQLQRTHALTVHPCASHLHAEALQILEGRMGDKRKEAGADDDTNQIRDSVD